MITKFSVVNDVQYTGFFCFLCMIDIARQQQGDIRPFSISTKPRVRRQNVKDETPNSPIDGMYVVIKSVGEECVCVWGGGGGGGKGVRGGGVAKRKATGADQPLGYYWRRLPNIDLFPSEFSLDCSITYLYCDFSIHETELKHRARVVQSFFFSFLVCFV